MSREAAIVVTTKIDIVQEKVSFADANVDGDGRREGGRKGYLVQGFVMSKKVIKAAPRDEVGRNLAEEGDIFQTYVPTRALEDVSVEQLVELETSKRPLLQKSIAGDEGLSRGICSSVKGGC